MSVLLPIQAPLQKHRGITGGLLRIRRVLSFQCRQGCRCTRGPIDGVVGKMTATAAQKFLAAEGFNPGPHDGVFGNMTAAAFQRYLIAQGYSCGETGADGRLRDGPISTKAFQRWLQKQGIDPRTHRRPLGSANQFWLTAFPPGAIPRTCCQNCQRCP